MGYRRMTGALIVAAGMAVSAVDAEGWTSAGRRQLARFYGARTSDGSRRGRPRKFDRPSRSVTLTLPEDVISMLQTIDADLSRAVVRVAQPLAPGVTRRPAEVVTYGNRAVIIVPRSRVLRERTGVELVPAADGRSLISMDSRVSVAQLELRLMDALSDASLDAESRILFETLVDILRKARNDHAIELRQRQIIVLQRKNGRKAVSA